LRKQPLQEVEDQAFARYNALSYRPNALRLLWSGCRFVVTWVIDRLSQK